MTAGWIIVAIAGLLFVGLTMAVIWTVQTANRLDRLHVRHDLSWLALDGALARRAVVSRAVATDAYAGSAPGHRLTAMADAAERAPKAGREAAENDLSGELALVDPTSVPLPLVAELADAEARVLLARRFHNDAVRDTLALRERPLVRLLHLGGTASMPSYFDISERANRTVAGPVGGRRSARVILLDEDGCVLLFCGSDPAIESAGAPRWWFTVGGAVQPGETLVQAATRELAEETGLRVDGATLIGPVWRRDAIIDFNGSVIRSEEIFFLHRTARFEPSSSGHTTLERRYIQGHRWCDEVAIRELAARGQRVYPVQLGERLAEANALASASPTAPEGDLEYIH